MKTNFWDNFWCQFIILCMAFCNFFSKKQIMIYKKGYLFLLIDIWHAIFLLSPWGILRPLGNRQACSASVACWEDEGWLGCSVDWICRHDMWYYHIYMLHVLYYWFKNTYNKFNNKNEPKSTCKCTIVYWHLHWRLCWISYSLNMSSFKNQNLFRWF